MRVLLIDVNYGLSSTGAIVQDIRRYLAKNGDEAFAAYGRGADTKDENVYRFTFRWEMALHALLTRLTGWTGRFSVFSTRRLIRYIDRVKPDVVHIHELHAYFVNECALLRALAKRSIPVCYTFHCDFMHTGKCGCAYACERYKTGCGHCPHLHEYPKTLLFDHTRAMLREKIAAVGALQRLICAAPSRWLAARAEGSLLPVDCVEVIPNGLDTALFRPVDASKLRERLSLGQRPVLLAAAPNFKDPHKGLSALLSLAKAMPDCALMLVGLGAPESFDNIVSVGRVPHEQMPEYYSLADAYVLTSDFETYSMTCAEALCCGAPVVGFRAGAPETVYPKAMATFVAPGDIAALAQAAGSALTQKDRRAETAAAAGKMFAPDTMGRAYRALYEKLTASPR